LDVPANGLFEAPAWRDTTIARSRVVVALAITLLISRLPEIVAREALGLDVPWMPWAIVVLTIALWLASRFVGALEPFERFLAVMIGVTLALALLPLITESALWSSLQPAETQPIVTLLTTRILFAIVAVVLLGWAMLLGASRDEVYARAGDLNARRRPGKNGGEAMRWRRFGPIAFVGLLLLMVWFGVPLLPGRIDLAAAAPYIGLGAIAALLNAFWEEVAFRAAPLSMLQRAIGPGSGVLLLALWFGLGHFYGGVPSGPIGLIATAAVGLLFGRAMIETRGLVWPVALHFAIDIVIFTFLAIASVG
jgi:membrane protease YdiL (CAAX protease family)